MGNNCLMNVIMDYNDEQIKEFVFNNDFNVVEKLRSDFEKEISALSDKNKRLKESIKVLGTYGITYDEKMSNDIIEINKGIIIGLEAKKNDIDKYLDEVREQCNHAMVDSWHDSHYSYFKCRKCGFECSF